MSQDNKDAVTDAMKTQRPRTAGTRALRHHIADLTAQVLNGNTSRDRQFALVQLLTQVNDESDNLNKVQFVAYARDAAREVDSSDDFRAPKPPVGSANFATKDARLHYAHVKECGTRIAEKLESVETPKLTRRVLETYLSDLGAQYFANSNVVRAAYEAVCLCVSRPPFPLAPTTADGEYCGNIEELLNRNPERSLAEARRLARHGFLKPLHANDEGNRDDRGRRSGRGRRSRRRS